MINSVHLTLDIVKLVFVSEVSKGKVMEHKIPREHIEAELIHTQIAEKHGKEIEQIGKKMQTHSELAAAGQVIQKSGEKVQAHAKAAYDHAVNSFQRQAQQDYEGASQQREQGTEGYCDAVNEHVKATKLYLAKSQAFSRAARRRLEAIQARTANARSHLEQSQASLLRATQQLDEQE
jgi:hypothetical protein